MMRKLTHPSKKKIEKITQKEVQATLGSLVLLARESRSTFSTTPQNASRNQLPGPCNRLPEAFWGVVKKVERDSPTRITSLHKIA